jgi:leucine dehydrogenase
MGIFQDLETHTHEQVIFCSGREFGLRAIIAIHDTTLGPALGGTRMWTYASDEAALRDALRLSRGMTYKAAVAGLNLGGGKAVILGDPRKDKSEILFRMYGRFIEGLSGRYITAEDVGTSVRDMEWVRMETRYVTGIDKALGGSGDPSPVTALGVYYGMKACVKKLTGSDSLSGKSVIVQGAGNVGSYLCSHLASEGVKIHLTDIDPDRVKAVADRTGASYIEPEKIYDVRADIFAPCALGAVINDETLPKLKVKIIAGGANNQLAEEEKHGAMLMEKGILYAPDYAINAGGLINVANELDGYSQERALTRAEGIYTTILEIFSIAEADGVPPHVASLKLAEDRIAKIGGLRKFFAGKNGPDERSGGSHHRT